MKARSSAPESGTTLVELMTALLMIAILATIAVPSYLQYLQRTRRTEAKTALLQIANNQARFYLQNNTYTSNLAQLGFPVDQTESGFYVVSVPVANALGFRAVAVPAAGSSQAGDADCQQFSIDAQSGRTAAPDPSGQCW